MCKRSLRRLQVTGAVYVDQARGFLDGLLRVESRGPGDVENALRRIATRERVSFSRWALRYRPPKDVYASVLFALRVAYEAARENQLKALEAELAAKKATGVAQDRLDEIEAVVRAGRDGS